MNPARYIVGDVFDTLETLEENSVDLVFSSPPFLALRSYLPADHPDKGKEIGSEATPADFLDTLLDVVEACDRVLAPHGSLCFDGDTYGGGGSSDPRIEADGSTRSGANRIVLADGRTIQGNGASNGQERKGAGWPLDKSLCGIPTLFAWSLAYGRNLLRPERETPRWRIRNLVVWARPNPPVGALGDKFRPATSYLTVATKARDRYFDLDAVRHAPVSGEPGAVLAESRSVMGYTGRDKPGAPGASNQPQLVSHPAGAPPLDYWVIPEDVLPGFDPPAPKPYKNPNTHARTAKGVESQERTGKSADRGGNWNSLPEQHSTAPAPPLDYWVIPTQPYAGSHYATFPEQLVVKPIASMSPQRVCRVCGEPSRRITSDPEYVERTGKVQDTSLRVTSRELETGGRERDGGVMYSPGQSITRTVDTLGWSDCGHNDWRPGCVLDPFAGSGTTLAVATGHGRDAIGIDLDSRNAELALERVGPLLLTVESLNTEGVA